MSGPRAVAVNVGANTNSPGFRGPLWPDGTFTYVPVPESEPTREPVPTYADLGLDLPFPLPDGVADTPVHLDPAFAEYACCDAYTYGDPHGVKARPLLDLAAGDHVYFYATLDAVGAGHPQNRPDWGAYVVGRFVLADDPVSGETFDALEPAEREAFAGNAHVKRDPFDARVLLRGDPTQSVLFDRAVPLSGATGTAANRVVTEWSADSGKGPWWRRPLRFDADATARLVEYVSEGLR